jgi:hypothetical protein
MSNQNSTPRPVHPEIPAESEKLDEQEKLDRVANEAAEQAGKTEQRYDRAHDIFTK